MKQSTPILCDDDDAEQEQISTPCMVEGSSNTSPTSTEISPTTTEVCATEATSRHRVRNRPAWMEDYEVMGVGVTDPATHFALFSDCDPIDFENAVKEEKWRKAMDDEIDSIKRNDTWEIFDLPDGQQTIGIKWVFKTKLKENGKVEKYKTRLVAKGYKQQHGIDYTEVFSPVGRYDTIRLVVALAEQNSWEIFQLDVKSAFLHGHLEEQVFVEQPPGYVKAGNEHKVYRLKKALYGLKQAPRAWYSSIEAYFLKAGFL